MSDIRALWNARERCDGLAGKALWRLSWRLGEGHQVPVLSLEVEHRSSAARAALRGASPLPHLLQRGHACGRGVACLGACLETGGAAGAPASKSSRADKADNHGLSGSARCNKCGSGLVPRSAARAALDLTGAKYLSANTSEPNRIPHKKSARLYRRALFGALQRISRDTEWPSPTTDPHQTH